MTIKLEILSNNDADNWDRLISRSPHGTLFHSWKWLKIIEKHTHMKLFPLIGMKGDIPIGVIPLFFKKKGPVRMVFSPPPHVALFYLGPVFDGFDSLKQEKKENISVDFQNSVDDFITNDLHAQYVNISISPALQDPRPYKWSGYTIESNFDYIIDLSKELDQLLQTLDKKGRQNLNRAKKRGITIEMGDKKEYEKILDLMEIRYAQQGKILTASRQYYLDIYEAFHENLKIFVAKVDGEVITGNIDFQYRNTHYSWIGNPKPKIPISPSPNDLLIWDSIRYAHERGCRYYITMSAAGNERLHSYYASKFDPELSVYFTAKKNSLLTGILEKGYKNMIKPLKAMMKPRL
jgi:lipid II:glycine glycyltransferase (peptidoglycan interpeptide bridge formation enzyme)